GGFLNEINPNLEVDKGDPAEKSRLLEFCGALGEQNPAKRLERMDKILDIDAYFRYLAMEQVLCHWDGYSFNQNNYRVYEDPGSGKFYFILHGMDQVYGDNRWYIFRQPAKAVPNALLFDKTMRERARTQFFGVYEKVLRPIDWPRRALEVAADLKIKLKPIDPEESKRFEQRGKDGAKQVRARMDFVKAQFEDAYRLRSPSGGKATLGNYLWFPSADKGQAKETALAGKECFYLQANADGRAEFRLALCLGPGRYRLEAKIQHKGIKAGNGEGAKGARLRLSGTPAGATVQAFLGDSPWKTVALDFTVTDSDPTLVMELPQGVAGELWMDRGSVQLVRLP
ncbi:MAG: hypothetical protein EBR62_08535, partial [Verrucomicrobia bacterium]|nr:hypothetical protein [Verrucomicrobiota bacterium]